MKNINGISNLTVKTNLKTDEIFCKDCKKYYRFDCTNKHDLVFHTCSKQGSGLLSEDTKYAYKCSACDKKFVSRSGKYRHYKKIHIEGRKANRPPRKKFFCDHCNEQFNFQTYSDHVIKNNLDALNDSEVANNVKCLECDKKYRTKFKFRRHLQEYHGFDMTPVNLTFSKIEAFYVWKRKIEMETLFLFHRKKGTELKPVPGSFECSRSGKFYPNIKKEPDPSRVARKKTNRQDIFCTAAIYLEKSSEGIAVTYFPVHYGHGKHMKVAKLSPEEEAAVVELTSQGMSYEELIKDLKGQDYVDYHYMFPIKKKYFRWVTSAYHSEDYATEKTDVEYISEWVQKCCQLVEVPILLCQQENIGCENEKFILAIMTEFQKQILLSSSKYVICVDTIKRTSYPHITVVSVIDELNTAFPVAYCISNKLNKDVMMEFFTCIKESTGNLSPKYLISSYHKYIFESWVEVMSYSPVWLWSNWFIENIITARFRIFLKNNAYLKNEFFSILHSILGCRNKDVCECMFKNFIHRIETDKKTEKLAHWIMKNLGINKEKWAHCYREEINCETNLNLEILHETFYKCGRMFKKRSIFVLITVLMKVLRYKIIDRLLSSVDNLKLNLAVNAIDICHEKGMDILPSQICLLSSKLWKIETEDFEKAYVTQEMEKCPDICNLKCKECNVCVHQFSCSCLHSMINANLCMHVHAIVFKLLGPFKDCVSTETAVIEDSHLEIGTDPSLEQELSNSMQFTTDSTISKIVLSSHKPSTTIVPVIHSLAAMAVNSSSTINIQKSDATQTEHLTCLPTQAVISSENIINNVQESDAIQTEHLTSLPTQAISYISPIQKNAQETISTQTELSVPSSETVIDITLSNQMLSRLAPDISVIPKFISKKSINSKISDMSKAKNVSNSRESLLLECMKVHQLMQSSKLDEGTIAGITKHMSASLNILKNSESNSLISSIDPVESKIEGKYKNRTKLDSVLKQLLKRPGCTSLVIKNNPSKKKK